MDVYDGKHGDGLSGNAGNDGRHLDGQTGAEPTGTTPDLTNLNDRPWPDVRVKSVLEWHKKAHRIAFDFFVRNFPPDHEHSDDYWDKVLRDWYRTEHDNEDNPLVGRYVECAAKALEAMYVTRRDQIVEEDKGVSEG